MSTLREEIQRFVSSQRMVRAIERVLLGMVRWIDFDRGLDADEKEGRLQWDSIQHCLKVGLDDYTAEIPIVRSVYCVNNTGAQLDAGTVVGYGGAASSNIELAKYLADNSAAALQLIGILANDVPDGEGSQVIAHGKITGLDTTGTPVGETWLEGDVLYGDPTTAGDMTKVKPTAPDTIAAVAAVLSVGVTNGAIFVKPFQLI